MGRIETNKFMCNCNSNSNSIYSCKYPQRSDMAVDDTDKDLANFIASTDYTTYLERFGRTPLAGRKRLLTYNNTTVQALWLPTINNADEKEVLFTFYRLGTTKYLSWVANTRGELSNLLDMNGEWKLLTVNNDVAITGLYTESKWNSFSFSPDINPSDLPFLTCMNQMLSSMGAGSMVVCSIDLELCLLGLAIDCAIQSL